METNDKVNWMYIAVQTIFGIFGILNIYRYFSKPDDSIIIKEQKRILEEKDKIIGILEKRILQYQQILDNDRKNKP